MNIFHTFLEIDSDKPWTFINIFLTQICEYSLPDVLRNYNFLAITKINVLTQWRFVNNFSRKIKCFVT